MARLGDEPLLRRKALLQAREHPVDGLGKPGQLVGAARVDREPPVQAPAVGNGRQLVDGRLERIETGAGQPRPDHHRDQQDDRSHQQHRAEQCGRSEGDLVETRAHEHVADGRVRADDGRHIEPDRRLPRRNRRGGPGRRGVFDQVGQFAEPPDGLVAQATHGIDDQDDVLVTPDQHQIVGKTLEILLDALDNGRQAAERAGEVAQHAERQLRFHLQPIVERLEVRLPAVDIQHDPEQGQRQPEGDDISDGEPPSDRPHHHTLIT